MITLEANYSKKIGLPGYSSHQFSITLKSELSDVSQVEQESARLQPAERASANLSIAVYGNSGYFNHTDGYFYMEFDWDSDGRSGCGSTGYYRIYGAISIQLGASCFQLASRPQVMIVTANPSYIFKYKK